MAHTKFSLAGRVVMGLFLFDTALPYRGMWQRLLRWWWELPQVMCGMLIALVRIVLGKAHRVESYHGVVYVIEEGRGDGRLMGVTLGCVVNIWLHGRLGEDFHYEVEHRQQGLLKHEFGHTVDSLRLGPMYLLVVGLPSLVSAALDGKFGHNHKDFYTEHWADRNAAKL